MDGYCLQLSLSSAVYPEGERLPFPVANYYPRGMVITALFYT